MDALPAPWRDDAEEGGGWRDGTPNLLLKHPNTIVATYV